MDLSTYQIFNAVATTQSFSKAARILYLSPSAVSHSMIKLEKKLGYPLFIRKKNQVSLTTYGKELLPDIQNLLSLHSKIEHEISALQNIQNGTVHLGAFNSTCLTWIPTIFKKLQEMDSNIHLIVHEGEYIDTEQNLLNGTLDIAFVRPRTIQDDLIEYEDLYLDKMICIAPSNMQFKQKGLITIDELRNLNLVISTGGYQYDVKPFFIQHHIQTAVTHTLYSDSAIISLVASGVGISILPALVVKSMPSDIQLLEIENNPYRKIGVATQKSPFITPATKIIKDVIKNVVAEFTPPL